MADRIAWGERAAPAKTGFSIDALTELLGPARGLWQSPSSWCTAT